VTERLAGLLLSREEARRLAILAGLGMAHLEQRNGCIAPDAVRLVEELEGFGRRNTRLQVSDAGESAKPPGPPVPAGSPGMDWTGASETAQLLGVSDQAARQFCRSGALIADRIPANGPWITDKRSAVALAARRARGK
jgi:hypothetical protein